MLSADILRYLGCLVLNIAAGRWVSRWDDWRVHIASVAISLFSTIVCFGFGAIVPLVVPVVATGVILNVVPRNWVGRVSAIILMTHLMYNHWHRDDSVWVLDHTGALMMLTLRLMGLCFDYADGKIQSTRVDWLCGFAYWYPTFLTGPPGNYADYMAWAHSLKSSTPPLTQIHKLLWLVGMTTVHLLLRSPLPTGGIVSITEFALASRAKYYVGWTLSELAAGACGRELTISNIPKVEFSVHARDVLAGWNIGTADWMKEYVYHRVPAKWPAIRVLSTSVFSGVWHGFHFGNVMSFAGVGILTMVSRDVYKYVRPLLDPKVYSVVVGVWTHMIVDFIMVSFVVLDVEKIFDVYNSTWYHGYIMLAAGWLLTVYAKKLHPTTTKKIE